MPISHDDFESVCNTFVDDSDLVHLPSVTITAQQLVIKMQQVLDHPKAIGI